MRGRQLAAVHADIGDAVEATRDLTHLRVEATAAGIVDAWARHLKQALIRSDIPELGSAGVRPPAPPQLDQRKR